MEWKSRNPAGGLNDTLADSRFNLKGCKDCNCTPGGVCNQETFSLLVNQRPVWGSRCAKFRSLYQIQQRWSPWEFSSGSEMCKVCGTALRVWMFEGRNTFRKHHSSLLYLRSSAEFMAIPAIPPCCLFTLQGLLCFVGTQDLLPSLRFERGAGYGMWDVLSMFLWQVCQVPSEPKKRIFEERTLLLLLSSFDLLRKDALFLSTDGRWRSTNNQTSRSSP